VQNYRERARARGLRPLQIWVPDTRTEEFRREAHRQSLVVERSAQAEEDQAFVDAVADLCEE
jgi:Protein  of unknown function (DUF3018)